MNDLRRAAELCEFCPKMCRFACPASEVTSREAFTPWGKVSLAVLAGRAPDESVALAFGACTGCLRCQTYCAHANDVPALLYAARSGAVRAGSAPAAWAEVARRMTAAGHAEETDLLAVHRRIAEEERALAIAARGGRAVSTSNPTFPSTPTSNPPSASNSPSTSNPPSASNSPSTSNPPSTSTPTPNPPSNPTSTPNPPSTPTSNPTSASNPPLTRGPPRTSALRAVAGVVTGLLRPAAEPGPPRPLLFAGCDALAAGGQVVREALAVARALDAPLGFLPESALCCGLKLAEAGHPELFAAHAARLRRALVGASRRPPPVHLVLLSPGCARAVRERWPALPDGSRVEHVTTYLSRALAARPDLRERPPLPGAAAYHDPCELARGLSELTAPRALLAAAVEELREPLRCGTDTSCCGANGLLPRTLPAVAEAIAEDRRRELETCGAPAVTASPGCAAALGATDVVTLLARWLGVGVEEAA